jgi:hypothetical protein
MNANQMALGKMLDGLQDSLRDVTDAGPSVVRVSKEALLGFRKEVQALRVSIGSTRKRKYHPIEHDAYYGMQTVATFMQALAAATTTCQVVDKDGVAAKAFSTAATRFRCELSEEFHRRE